MEANLTTPALVAGGARKRKAFADRGRKNSVEPTHTCGDLQGVLQQLVPWQWSGTKLELDLELPWTCCEKNLHAPHAPRQWEAAADETFLHEAVRP